MKIFNIILITALITGCTYYQTAPGIYSTSTSPTSKYDQSWSAAVGAFADQGVLISVQDRGAGYIQGNRDGIEVTGNIRTQADGSVRVQFDTSGAISRDPTLNQRITGSYNRRMGR